MQRLGGGGWGWGRRWGIEIAHASAFSVAEPALGIMTHSGLEDDSAVQQPVPLQGPSLRL